MRHLVQRAFLLICAVYLAACPAALAVEANETLPDARLETRARSISENLRCLVCQNQSIDDSNADLAHDLRVLVRDRLKKGDTDEQVYDYVVARYGDFVLLNPPFKAKTLLLWGGPAIVFVLGLTGIFFYFRRRGTDAVDAAPLDADEERRLNALLNEEPKG